MTALAVSAAVPAVAQAPNPVSVKPLVAPAVPAKRPVKQDGAANATSKSAASQKQRTALMSPVKTWAIQLQNLSTASPLPPVDMFVADATAGGPNGGPLSADDVARLKSRPGGKRRIAISYLSIGESEDYRPDYFTSEYMSEDAPDWLLKENQQWKGNRLIRFCEEGWQRTVLGDDDGHSVYNSVEWSPLYKLIDLGFDGVYLDRVDVYGEVQKECPGAAEKMVAFVARLAAHARKKKPDFIVILQNAEELLRDPKMIAAIDAVAKEDLFYGADHSERANPESMVSTILENLAFAKRANRPVFVLDYLKDPSRRETDRAKIEAHGFIPYIGPRKLDQLWPQGAQF